MNSEFEETWYLTRCFLDGAPPDGDLGRDPDHVERFATLVDHMLDTYGTDPGPTQEQVRDLWSSPAINALGNLDLAQEFIAGQVREMTPLLIMRMILGYRRPAISMPYVPRKAWQRFVNRYQAALWYETP